MPANATVESTLVLSAAEIVELRNILESALTDIHVEKRRTEAREYHDVLARRETLIRGLVDKLAAFRG